MSIDRKMDKENVYMCRYICVHINTYVCICAICIHTHNIEYEIYSAIKSGSPDICDNMSELWRHYAKRNKPDKLCPARGLTCLWIWKETQRTREQIDICQKRVGRGRGRKMHTSSRKLHTSNYKINNFWKCNVQHGDYKSILYYTSDGC